MVNDSTIHPIQIVSSTRQSTQYNSQDVHDTDTLTQSYLFYSSLTQHYMYLEPQSPLSKEVESNHIGMC